MSGEVETEAESGSANKSERKEGVSGKRWREKRRKRRGEKREGCRERWGEKHQYSL